MTEMKFLRDDTEFKLTCTLNTNMYKKIYCYSFKLEQRERRKRKWLPIKEQKSKYEAYTDIDTVLKYLSKEQVMSVAEIEYQKMSPSKLLFNE